MVASVAVIGLSAAGALSTSASAALAPVDLGTAGAFSVLAGSGITNTGPTTLGADIGSFPTPTETGLGTMTVLGTNHAGDAVTQQAKVDLTNAYGVAAGLPPTSVATELGGTTLTPGVYNGATLQITGTLTLDTQGDPAAVFVFQTQSTLVTASNSAVTVLNGLRACNVFWQVGSSATLGTGSHLAGTVLAYTSISATTGATVQGRLLAENGAVTLDTNVITDTGCTASNGTTTTAATTPTTTTGASSTTTSPATPTTTGAGSTTTSPAMPTTTAGAGSPTTLPATATTTAVVGSTTSSIAAVRPTSASPTAASSASATPSKTGSSSANGPGSPTTGPRPGPPTPTPRISTAGPPKTPSTSVPALPYTGSDPLATLVTAALSIAAGVVMVGASKRARRTR